MCAHYFPLVCSLVCKDVFQQKIFFYQKIKVGPLSKDLNPQWLKTLCTFVILSHFGLRHLLSATNHENCILCLLYTSNNVILQITQYYYPLK